MLLDVLVEHPCLRDGHYTVQRRSEFIVEAFENFFHDFVAVPSDMVAGDLFDVLKLDDKLHFAWHQWILVAENFDLVIFFLELSGVIRQDHDDLIFENTFESDDVLQELFKALVYV